MTANATPGDGLYERVAAAAAHVRGRLGGRAPTIGLILGSGLGGWADRLGDPVTIDYGEIPHFPRSHVEGHKGRLVVGTSGGATCVAMQGRVHLYEGHPAALVAFPARVLVALGARTLIITNAAGGLRPEWAPGTLMVIRDHLDMLRDHPLRGPNDDRLGPRFPDMTRAYAPELRALVKDVAAARGVAIQEGVYVAMPGPTYETPAEVKMLQGMGADATGMSTVPEVIVANHMGARCIGISCITNKAAGITGEPLSHAEVTETATRVRAEFEGLLDGVVAALAAPAAAGGAA
ncbi:MAG: purine-nucleoside phosphorylase [Kofleriaceae bacterium]|nr:purine-nucleoside phosphorylase [Myxococcales bacterium]MCB9565020.1 purine-nucleoside phosphorylase [Kofleriaceae bacterium]MCB9575067.1 purine-nucleoside phosphorylase [Kofleriaceae bacterium]